MCYLRFEEQQWCTTFRHCEINPAGTQWGGGFYRKIKQSKQPGPDPVDPVVTQGPKGVEEIKGIEEIKAQKGILAMTVQV